MKFLDLVVTKLSPLLKSNKAKVIFGLIFPLVYYTTKSRKVQQIPEVKLSYFLQAIKENLISEIIVDKFFVMFRGFNSEGWFKTNTLLLKKDRIFKLIQDKPQIQISCTNFGSPSKDNYTLPLIFSIAYIFGIFLYTQKQINKKFFRSGHWKTIFEKSRATTKSNVKFTSIYGLDLAKKQLNQIIEYLTNPQRYKQIGARLRRGIIIYGPPGTGKTMLAKATANESAVNFIYCSATEFMEMYVGMGPKRVRQLFQQARDKSPAIIFIDEIDSIAYKRKNKNFDTTQTNDTERDNTLNQLLCEIDGFNETENIVVIAATNRIGILDDAFMRSGRFDIKIEIQLPNLDDRFGILKLHLEKKRHSCTNDKIQLIAHNTEGFSGADMENIANEAAYIAVDEHRNIIGDEDIQKALQKLMNERKDLNKSYH